MKRMVLIKTSESFLKVSSKNKAKNSRDLSDKGYIQIFTGLRCFEQVLRRKGYKFLVFHDQVFSSPLSTSCP